MPKSDSAEPVQRARRIDAAARDDAYEPGSPVNQGNAGVVYIPVICRICSTRMYGTSDQVGQELRCPDCYAYTVIPPAPPTATAMIPLDIGAPLEVAEPIETPSLATLGYAELFTSPADDSHYVEASSIASSARAAQQGRPVFAPLPRWPLLNGVLLYPFHPRIIIRLIVLLCLEFMLVGLFAGFNVVMKFSMGSQVGGFFIALTSIGTAFWLAYLSSFWIAILQTTADGNDDPAELAASYWAERFFESLYLAGALTYASIPGWLLYPLTPAALTAIHWLPIPAAVELSLFVFYPIVQLSLLETVSPLNPFSRPIWRSVWRVWWGWAGFYAVAALLYAAGRLWTAWLFQGTLPSMVWVLPGLTVLATVYIRLLGRLAWYCAEKLDAPRKKRKRRAVEIAEQAARGAL